MVRTCTPTINPSTEQAPTFSDTLAGRLERHVTQDGIYRPQATSDCKELPIHLNQMRKALQEAERERATWELQVALRREHVETARLRVEAQALDEQLMAGTRRSHRTTGTSDQQQESSGETIREQAEEFETSAISFSGPAFVAASSGGRAAAGTPPGEAAALALKDFSGGHSSGQLLLAGKQNEGWITSSGGREARFEDSDHSPRWTAVGGS